MPNEYQVGDLVRISAAFTDSDSAAADPTTVTAYYKDPSGNTTELVYDSDTSDVTKDSTGNYHVDVSIDEQGKWFYRWKGTGAVQAADEYWFTIERLNIST